MIAGDRKSDTWSELQFSDLVICNITTPNKHWPISRICLRTGKNLKGLGCCDFARHYFRNRYLLSLPQPTKMFQFSWFPFNVPMYSVRDNMTLLMLGSPIRKSPDHSLLTATRSLSQSSTSFIGNIRLGIHFVPLSTFLCIDLTSNCYRAKTKPSIYKNSNFFCKLLTSLRCHTLRAHSSSARMWWTICLRSKLFQKAAFW